MSGLYASLNASVSALSAQSRAVETAGKNLANVNNPSYARQRVIAIEHDMLGIDFGDSVQDVLGRVRVAADRQ